MHTALRFLASVREAGHVRAGISQHQPLSFFDGSEHRLVVRVVRGRKKRVRLAFFRRSDTASAGLARQMRRQRRTQMRVGEIDPRQPPIPDRRLVLGVRNVAVAGTAPPRVDAAKVPRKPRRFVARFDVRAQVAQPR